MREPVTLLPWNRALNGPWVRAPLRILCATGMLAAGFLGAGLSLNASQARADARPEMPLVAPAVQESFDSSAPTNYFEQARSQHATLSQASIEALELAIGRYAAIVSAGGWPRIPDVKDMHIGTRNPAVAQLRERLRATGDLSQSLGRKDVFDSYVAFAVRRYQQRNGLQPDGVVDQTTLDALNVPADMRLQQMRINIERIREFLKGKPERFIAVNIPAQELEAVEDGKVASRHTTIVGKVDRPTPVLESKVFQLNFNPYWHVPVSIVRRDIIPRMQKDPQYLANNQIRAFDGDNNEVPLASIDWHSEEPMKYQYRQDPGEDLNSLGAVKINFHNKHAVFLHDTPGKDLFSEETRTFSSGCVRVQNIEHLITWILNNQKGDDTWTRRRVDAIIRSGERLDMDMSVQIPLFLVYVTAWANPDGTVQFRRDFYNRDSVSRTANTY